MITQLDHVKNVLSRSSGKFSQNSTRVRFFLSWPNRAIMRSLFSIDFARNQRVYNTGEQGDSDARRRRRSGTTKCSKIISGSWRGGGRALFVALIDAILRGRTALFQAATQPPEPPSIPKYPGWLVPTSVKYFPMLPMSQLNDDTRFLAALNDRFAHTHLLSLSTFFFFPSRYSYSRDRSALLFFLRVLLYH